MATFNYSPSYTTNLTQTPKINEAVFGDGYVQATTRGINYNPKTWNLVFNNRTDADADAIVNFFRNNTTATTPFDWTDPEGAAGRYKCKTWTKSKNDYGVYNITAKFEEVFW